MAPVAPVVVAGAATVGKTVLQGTVLIGSTVAAVKGIQALGGGGDHGSQNVMGALLAHLEQKEQKQTSFFLFDFEGGVGYFTVIVIILLVMTFCCRVAHCCNCTPMARHRIQAEYNRQNANHQIMHMLASQRSRRASVNNVTVRQNIQPLAASPPERPEPRPSMGTSPSTHPVRVEDGAGTKRRESSVIPDEGTSEV